MIGRHRLVWQPRHAPRLSRHVPRLSRHVPGLSRHAPGLSRHVPGLSRHVPRPSSARTQLSSLAIIACVEGESGTNWLGYSCGRTSLTNFLLRCLAVVVCVPGSHCVICLVYKEVVDSCIHCTRKLFASCTVSVWWASVCSVCVVGQCLRVQDAQIIASHV